MIGTYATSWLGTESQSLMCVLRSSGGFLCHLTRCCALAHFSVKLLWCLPVSQ